MFTVGLWFVYVPLTFHYTKIVESCDVTTKGYDITYYDLFYASVYKALDLCCCNFT